MDEIDDVVGRWCAATERRDSVAATDCLTADVVLNSPVSAGAPLRGREQVRQSLAVAFAAVQSIDFHTRLDADASCALFARARLGTQLMDEALLIRLDGASGLIRELTLFARPLSALAELAAVFERMARAG